MQSQVELVVSWETGRFKAFSYIQWSAKDIIIMVYMGEKRPMQCKDSQDKNKPYLSENIRAEDFASTLNQKFSWDSVLYCFIF